MASPDADERVRIAREYSAAFRDEGVDGWSRFWHPEIEFDMTPMGFPGIGVYWGKETVAAFVREFLSSFDDYFVELEEVVPGPEAVLLVFRQGGRGSASHVPVDMHIAHVSEIEGGLVKRIRAYNDIAEARRVAGSPPDP